MREYVTKRQNFICIYNNHVLPLLLYKKEKRTHRDVIVFEKLRYHDGFVWTVGLTVEIKLRFQISPATFDQWGVTLRWTRITFRAE